MIEDLRMRTEQENELDEASNHIISSHGLVRAKQMQVLDLERNILQVCVKVLFTLHVFHLIQNFYLLIRFVCTCSLIQQLIFFFFF